MSSEHARKATNHGDECRCCRSFCALLLLLTLFSSTGASCAHSIRNPFARLGPPAPEIITPAATLDQVMQAVNQNAGRIQNYQTNNASISVPGMLGVPLMSGRIAAERPMRLRLVATAALLGPVVDLGSNDDLFWFWAKQNEPPAVYFARHAQFAGGAAHRTLPIQPQWLLDALGLAEFNPADVHQGPTPLGDGKLEITTIMQSPSGPVKRQAVIDASRAWVLEQHFYDAEGSPLASATARTPFRYYQELGVSLPQKIDIKLPAAELELSIDVGDVIINGAPANPQLWQMPTIAGSPPVDVGAAAVNPYAPTVGSQMLRGDWSTPPLVAGLPTTTSDATPNPIPMFEQSNAAASGQLPSATTVSVPQRLSQQPLAASAPTQVEGGRSTQPIQRLPAGGVATREFVDSPRSR